MLVAWVLGAAPAAGQGIRSQFEIGVGRTIPAGDFRQDVSGEGFDGGWTSLGGVTLQRPPSRLGLRIDATYGANGANDRLKTDLTTSLGQPSDETLKLLGANAAVAYRVTSRSRIAPSLFAGVGVYHVTIAVTSGSVTTHNSATRLAWNAGGQLTYRALWLELRYVAVAAAAGFPRTTFLPITLGIRSGER